MKLVRRILGRFLLLIMFAATQAMFVASVELACDFPSSGEGSIYSAEAFPLRANLEQQRPLYVTFIKTVFL